MNIIYYLFLIMFALETPGARASVASAPPCTEDFSQCVTCAYEHGMDLPKNGPVDIQTFARAYFGGDTGLRFINNHPKLYKGVSVDTLKTTWNAMCSQGIEALFPKNPTYRNLQKAYQTLNAKKGDVDPAFTLTHTLKPGDISDAIPAVRRYLNFYGYAGGDAQSTTFDPPLKLAVEQFQGHHFEKADGVIGPKTQKMLRYTHEQRLNFVRANMARWRALCLAHDTLNKRENDPLGERYLLINVADYSLCGTENDACTLIMKTIVGQPGRKTPLFQASMQHMIFNPTWTIPGGILMKDKVPRMMRDANYAAKIGQLTGVDPYSVDWSDPGSRPSITYPPGPGNPLGRVKFFIKNNDAIYLHDTDTPSLFQEIYRARSSGCVRLEQPLALVAWLDKNGPYNTQSRVEDLLRTTRTTKSHDIEPDVPCYFIYLTSGVSDDGFVWYSDPYGYD